MVNYCDTYIALDCEKTHELEMDPFEEIEVYIKDLKDVPAMVRSGEINHSIILAAFYMFEKTRVC